MFALAADVTPYAKEWRTSTGDIVLIPAHEMDQARGFSSKKTAPFALIYKYNLCAGTTQGPQGPQGPRIRDYRDDHTATTQGPQGPQARTRCMRQKGEPRKGSGMDSAGR